MYDNHAVICLGDSHESFRFNPTKVHDLYAEAGILYIEIVVDGMFIATYEFEYSDPDELLKDFKSISKCITSHEASCESASAVM